MVTFLSLGYKNTAPRYLYSRLRFDFPTFTKNPLKPPPLSDTITIWYQKLRLCISTPQPHPQPLLQITQTPNLGPIYHNFALF